MLIGYARVSTHEQNLDLQLDALASEGVERIFSDKVSGSRLDRPGLNAMKGVMREGDTVIVWKMDRLFRSTTDMIQMLNELSQNGIGFRSIQEPFIDTTSSSGKLLLHVFAAMAEFERDLIRERSLAGLYAARARGRLGGRPKVMTPNKMKLASRMMRNKSISISEICSVLGVSRSTLYRHIAPDGQIREQISG